MNSPLISRLRLSVLDQSVALAGRAQNESIRETLALAQWCEALGYHRFWVSEHHSHPTIVGSAPEVLMAAIAARTSRIRIGSAGVMLPHYAPLKVAEQFRVLDALAPGRIDLGVGRAPGSDFRTAQLLNPDTNASAHFPQQVMALQAWTLEGESGGPGLPPGHPGHGVHAYPHGPTAPAIWMLGSSDYGAELAAHLGLPYAFAYFITEGQGAAQALALYRSGFRASPALAEPLATLCVWALAADTEAEARHLFKSRERFRMDRNTGRLGPLLPPDEAARPYSPAEQAQLDQLRANALVGSGAQVADGLRRLAAAHGVDELVVITWAHDPAARRRSYELLAREFDLG
ncbi:luciferase family oxidoreductase [Rhodoferax koreense]|uniref:Luciferase-like monooxygenase n=1 Tax=Rhodoferax koreensis TaxID=1842727 RepID=A0A1P8JVS8_9BURK|nr:LLM class flavin-dependent oxidoreductase [Rhodoferax koreense]APW37879.1 luciferase family oxidoreductase [Rhodoferax koreense]